jgi:hypothetical protein
MIRVLATWTLLLGSWTLSATEPAERLPFSTVFVGEKQFEEVIKRAHQEKWADIPFGKRITTFGKHFLGVPYKNYTLEIDDRIEAPSVNFEGMDCWTFFEIALALARLMDFPPEHHHPQMMLKLIELDRYRGGVCTGSYLSRLHYLEDWARDNHRRDLVQDITPQLGGKKAPLRCREMTIGWKHYRYMRENPDLREGIRKMEERVEKETHYYITKSQVPKIEDQLQEGDIIGIYSWNQRRLSTSHVGLATRDKQGVLRFMHATTQKRYGRSVAMDSRLSTYLNRFRTHGGILVARPLPLSETRRQELMSSVTRPEQ